MAAVQRRNNSVLLCVTRLCRDQLSAFYAGDFFFVLFLCVQFIKFSHISRLACAALVSLVIKWYARVSHHRSGRLKFQLTKILMTNAGFDDADVYNKRGLFAFVTILYHVVE